MYKVVSGMTRAHTYIHMYMYTHNIYTQTAAYKNIFKTYMLDVLLDILQTSRLDPWIFKKF